MIGFKIVYFEQRSLGSNGCFSDIPSMIGWREKSGNLLQYLGVKSSSYYHTEPKVVYRPDDLMPYYFDQTQRAAWIGPFDDHGIPLWPAGGKTYHLPVHILMYGLGHFELHRQKGEGDDLTRATNCARWLLENQQADGSWLNPGPIPKFAINGDFRSGMTQGLAISFLLRMHRAANDEQMRTAAVRSFVPYTKGASEGGVRYDLDAGPFFDEFPSPEPSHVLNGGVFALLGLYDLVRFEACEEAGPLWNEGVACLKSLLPQFDTGYWSLYHIGSGGFNPATVPYHRLHIDQMRLLGMITGEPIFQEYAVKWERYLSRFTCRMRALAGKIRWLASK